MAVKQCYVCRKRDHLAADCTEQSNVIFELPVEILDGHMAANNRFQLDRFKSFLELKSTVENNEMTLFEIINKIKASIKDPKKFCAKIFASKNKQLIEVLLYSGLFGSDLLLNQVCSLIMSGQPVHGHGRSDITIGKLKKSFRTSFRRIMISPWCNESFSDLSSKIVTVVKDITPGKDDVELLWNKEIEACVENLFTAQHQNICRTTENVGYQRKWFQVGQYSSGSLCCRNFMFQI